MCCCQWFGIPTKTSIFYLNELAHRLLAPRIAYQKLMQTPKRKQLNIQSNNVNVPADVTYTVSMVPRLSSETAKIKVNLKRKLQYESSAMSSSVRPHKVVEGTLWFTSNSNL